MLFMVEEVKPADTNTKTQLSLAAALFFSPLVQNMLKNDTRDISDKDRDFVRGYIKFGYITILFGIITIVSGVLNYLLVLDILNVIYTVSIFILVFLLIISVVSILSDISLIKSGDQTLHIYTIEGNKKDIILKYLPIYNIYLWYQIHTFDKPNRRIKESILLRTLFLLICLSGSIWASSCILIVIIIRVAALMSDIDFLTPQTKQYINQLFFKNPEEIRWYVSWLGVYLAKAGVNIFKKTQAAHLSEEIAQEKEVYSRIIDTQDNKDILYEYILWIILTGGLLYFVKLDFTIRTYYAVFLLGIARYLVMILQLKHLPHLPIAREILLLIKRILKKN